MKLGKHGIFPHPLLSTAALGRRCFGSPCPLVHRTPWLTESLCAPCTLAHSAPWFNMPLNSPHALAHHAPWLTARLGSPRANPRRAQSPRIQGSWLRP
eukprot:366529-Chlamydomonas_euryale.AAC.16